MAFSDFFSNDFETSSSHQNKKLVTRHYRADYHKAKMAVVEACEKLGLSLVEIIEDYHEIRCENRKQEMIIEVFSNSFFDQAIDVKVNTKYLIGFGRGIKLIESFYALLNKALQPID